MTADTVLFKKCHQCGHLMELSSEIDKCTKCSHNFLPSNYFSKIHNQGQEYKELFTKSAELHEDELIKGLHVLW